MADVASSQPQRKRARQACLACNSRRVKCDVTEQQPCQNCVTANVPCETRESRRGKHPRPSKKRQSVDSGASGSRAQNDEEVAGAHVLASLHRNVAGEAKPDPAGFMESEQTTNGRPDLRTDEDGNVFLGETTSLRYVHDEINSQATTAPSTPLQHRRLRYNVPSAARAEALIPDWEADRRRRRREYLQQAGVFSFPSPPIAEGLLKAYFRWFHPCFAIVDEMNLWEEHANGTLSPLLLQAMLFVGVLHCEDSVLQALGEGHRHQAKYIFFTRAKELYDADIEMNKITVIQSLFLMSFWRAGALLEKDVRHWLGAAVSLAQTKALHRAQGTAQTQAAKLRRRIWWSLYSRDRQCAAALGLPNRVRDEDCDFERLELSDFEYAFNPATTPPADAEHYARYAIGITELAQYLGQIVHTGYLPNKTLDMPSRETMRIKLEDWKSNLPPSIHPESNTGRPHGFLTNMLHLAYNNLMVLLYRQDYIDTKQAGREDEGGIAIHAATTNTRIIEDMLNDNSLRHGQIHVITNLFNTLCLHTITLRRSEGNPKTVATSRAKLCLNGLQELQKTWEVTNWVLQLFFQYLDRATAASLRVQQQDDSGYLPSLVSKWAGDSDQRPQDLKPTPQTMQILTSLPAWEPAVAQTMAAAEAEGASPWTWTSEEANQLLFSRIENDFGFGEGEIPDWNPQEVEFNPAFWQQGSMPQGNGTNGSNGYFLG